MMHLHMVVAALALSHAAATAGWEKVSQKHGITLERRAVPGSSYPELRASSTSKATARALALKMWSRRDPIPFANGAKVTRTVLSEAAQERILHERINAPFLSDRDYVIRLRLVEEPGGSYRVEYAPVPGGPPPVSGVVRVTRMYGEYRFEPTATGTRVSYLTFSDPAGDVPAFIVKAAQVKGVPQDLQAWLEWLGTPVPDAAQTADAGSLP